ncbi:1619_t:CDS:2, partial [Dentiscutata heterogama]
MEHATYAQQYRDIYKFKKIKGNIGELQVLDTLNRLGSKFFSRFSIKYYGDDGIDIQGFFNSTYYIIQVKFQANKQGIGEITKFKEKIQVFKNTIGIIFCPSGLRPSKLVEELLKKPLQQKLKLHLIRYSYEFPFDLENDISDIGYVGFHYIGTFELRETNHHIIVCNKLGASRSILEAKLEEFKKAKNCYLPEYYFVVFIIDCWDYDVLLKLIQDSNIIVSSLNNLEELKKQLKKCIYHTNPGESFDEISSDTSYKEVIMYHRSTQTENPTKESMQID